MLFTSLVRKLRGDFSNHFLLLMTIQNLGCFTFVFFLGSDLSYLYKFACFILDITVAKLNVTVTLAIQDGTLAIHDGTVAIQDDTLAIQDGTICLY